MNQRSVTQSRIIADGYFLATNFMGYYRLI